MWFTRDILKHLADLKEPAPQTPSKPTKNSLSIKSPSPVTRAEFTDMSVASERREAAAAMVRAKGDIPHIYLNVECEVPSWLVEHGETI